MTQFMNPFKDKNSTQAILWDMLVARDINAFVRCDWTLVHDDFIAEKFLGFNANFFADPAKWSLSFPTLQDYKNSWLKQAHDSNEKNYIESFEAALHRVTTLSKIEIKSDKAAIWKNFDGTIQLKEGQSIVLKWQTIYFCQLIDCKWKIIGFIGYLPLSYDAPVINP